MDHVLALASPSPCAPSARLRAALLWLGVSAGAALAVATLGPGALGLVRAPGTTFAALLVQCCTVVALVAVGGLWLAATEVARTVVLRAGWRGRPRRVGPVRAGLLALCGITVLAAPAAAAAAHPDPADPAPAGPAPGLAGLPLPDRPLGGTGGTGGTGERVVVRPGDTLWAIAARALGPGATAGEVAAYWPRIQARNRAVVGPDPDRILPGQVLHLPPLP